VLCAQHRCLSELRSSNRWERGDRYALYSVWSEEFPKSALLRAVWAGVAYIGGTQPAASAVWMLAVLLIGGVLGYNWGQEVP
jgi:hypothetical protein